MILKITIILNIFLINFCYALDEDLKMAHEIVQSRIEYYKVRGSLLTGKDPVSKQFQTDLSSNDAGVHTAIGVNVEKMLACVRDGKGMGTYFLKSKIEKISDVLMSGKT